MEIWNCYWTVRTIHVLTDKHLKLSILSKNILLHAKSVMNGLSNNTAINNKDVSM